MPAPRRKHPTGHFTTVRAFLNRAGERMWPRRSRRPPPPNPPPIVDDSAAHCDEHASAGAQQRQHQQTAESDGEDDDDGMLESENFAAVVATPRPHAPLNGASDVGHPTVSSVRQTSEIATAMSSVTTVDSTRKTAQKSRMELIFQCGGDDQAALVARLKGRKFSTPENFISHGPMVSRRKGPPGGSVFSDLVEEEEAGTVGGFRRTVSTSALRLQNRSLFWKAL